METAAQEPLPDLLGLGRFGAEFRKGQTALIAAEPNHGKSVAALWLGVNWAKRGLRGLYFSADTDEYTTWRRAAATVTGQPQSAVEHLTRAQISTALEPLGGRLAFDFDTDPTYDHIIQEVIAFYELWGAYPDFVIIDNLMDVVGDNEDEFRALTDHTKAFKRLARATGSAVIMLHHCNEDGKPNQTHPPARSDITGKVSKKPELVLTLLYQDRDQFFLIAPVKNRDGEKDKSGQLYLTLRSDFSRMQFYDYEYQKLGAT